MADSQKVPIPFSEPPYLCGLPSPYYSDSHRAFQKRARTFIGENLIANALDWEREGTVPPHVFETFAREGWLIPTLPAPLPVDWLKKLGIHKVGGGVKVEEWDYLHTLIYTDEVGKLKFLYM
jgi:acyl-CoA dehydrogenase